ncbi:MAG TPA: asparagine synthase-related protein, partial [Polyangiales bacterium]|nr:asparagine synthase-related protein [Polyangiales bacterium]
QLEREGYVFRTTSDTEVLLHLYAARGVKMLNELRGMFAFGLWDESERRMLLARDPYGIKPLYYASEGGTLRFASQVRALLAGRGVSRTPDPAGQVGFYLWGSVPEPFTSYEAIKSLPAGNYAWCTTRGVSEPVAYWSVARVWADACQASTVQGNGIQERVSEALRDSVAHHMVADVPVSAFLSGGVDSGALVALMTEQGVRGTHAITLAFDEFSGRMDDEVPLATALARNYDVVHHVRRVSRSEFTQDLPSIFAAMDQPTIDGVNTWFVSKAASEFGLKVAISGLGGDELFAGYSTFRDVPRFLRAARWAAPVPLFGKLARRLSSRVFRNFPSVHPKLSGLFEYGGSFTGAYLLKRGLFMPWELPELLPEDRVREGLARLCESARLQGLLSPEPESSLAKVAALEAGQYMRNQLLRDTDWASMSHSLEVRVPLVDPVLLAQLAPMISHMQWPDGKTWLAKSPRRELPPLHWQREKTGFSTPLEEWLANVAELDTYRRVPLLARDGCQWARRYAYVVHGRFE